VLGQQLVDVVVPAHTRTLVTIPARDAELD
jgi:hypothetical protein